MPSEAIGYNFEVHFRLKNFFIYNIHTSNNFLTSFGWDHVVRWCPLGPPSLACVCVVLLHFWCHFLRICSEICHHLLMGSTCDVQNQDQTFGIQWNLFPSPTDRPVCPLTMMGHESGGTRTCMLRNFVEMLLCLIRISLGLSNGKIVWSLQLSGDRLNVKSCF